MFSKSLQFTKTDAFAYTESETLLPIIPPIVPDVTERGVNIDPEGESNKGGKLGTGAIAGITVGAVAAAAIIAAIIFFVIRKKRNIIDEEDIETLDGTESRTNTDNPIYNKNGQDDPFKEDF